jgi:hypothetical protein
MLASAFGHYLSWALDQKKMQDCIGLVWYWTGSGFVSSFNFGTGLTGCWAVKHLFLSHHSHTIVMVIYLKFAEILNVSPIGVKLLPAASPFTLYQKN